MKYCIIVIVMQQSSAAFTRLLVFLQAVKKDSETKPPTCNTSFQLLSNAVCVTMQHSFETVV